MTDYRDDIDNNPSVLPKDVHDFIFGRAKGYYKKKLGLLSTKYKDQPEKREQFQGYLQPLHLEVQTPLCCSTLMLR